MTDPFKLFRANTEMAQAKKQFEFPIPKSIGLDSHLLLCHKWKCWSLLVHRKVKRKQFGIPGDPHIFTGSSSKNHCTRVHQGGFTFVQGRIDILIFDNKLHRFIVFQFGGANTKAPLWRRDCYSFKPMCLQLSPNPQICREYFRHVRTMATLAPPMV